ncbi:MAG: septum formation protein Maf [Bacteroidales bacterium]|nr:septum formation protein Maf [Bacteroidales bacterium]
MLNNKKLLLASASPRRRELLSKLDADTEIVKLHDVDESYPDDLAPEKVSEYIATLKRDAYDRSMLGDGEVLVTADTVVILDGKVLGKPHSEEEAREMLAMMSGRRHKVVTGVTLTSRDRSVVFSDETLVKFAELTSAEIDYYVERYRPLDKAGAYGIQEWIGYIGIEGIVGCYYNVMGLPLNKLYQHLREL